MKNKYLINLAKRFWFWFWKKLMNGFAPTDQQGNYKFVRQKYMKLQIQ